MKPRGNAYRAACVALTLLLTGLVSADSWGPPRKEHWSANRSFVLRVDDKAKTLTLKHDTGNDFALDWSIKYPQESSPGYATAPNIAYVSDKGKHVVLCNVHTRLGYGKVLVFLDESGEVIKTYELEEFLTEEEVLYASHTISSIWWANYELHFLDEELGQFQIITEAGTLVVFDLQTGEILDLSPEEAKQAWAKGLAVAREYLADDDIGKRQAGAMLARVLDDKESIGLIIPLLDDTSVKWQVSGERSTEVDYRVQGAAGYVLAKLMGAEAAPLFEAKLDGANSVMTKKWIGFLADIGVAAKSEAVLAQTNHDRLEIARDAIVAILESDDGTVFRDHPEWLTHVLSDVRYRAVKLLPVFGDSRDYEHLKRALWDEDSTVSIWALRGLIELDPPELIKDLSEVAEGESHNEHEYAVIELARRGIEEYQAKLVVWLKLLAGNEQERGESPLHMSAALDSMKVLAETKPDGAVEALRAMLVSDAMNGTFTGTYLKIGVLGALAAMGHRDVLPELRKLASEGDALDRRRAIEMLAYCKDTEFIPELTAMLGHRESWIREAAKAALIELGAPVPDPPETGAMTLAGSFTIWLYHPRVPSKT